MTELKAQTEAEIEDFDDELSDEALGRPDGRFSWMCNAYSDGDA